MKAIEIARTGNPKSGYPELSDALYHALAIVNEGIFVTNDSKYVAKVKKFGRVAKRLIIKRFLNEQTTARTGALNYDNLVLNH